MKLSTNAIKKLLKGEVNRRVSGDSIDKVADITEKFVSYIGLQAEGYAKARGAKTVDSQDITTAIRGVDWNDFLNSTLG